MKNRYIASINEKVVIRKLLHKDINNLISAGFLFKSVLDQSLGNRFSKRIGIIPQETGLVACNIQEDNAIGFLSLVEHTNWLYSIKWVFVDPIFRKLGIATGLINYAKSLAKEHGARKIFLNANYNDSSLADFYIKRGFSLIVDASMVWGGGYSSKLHIGKSVALNSFEVGSEKKKRSKASQLYEKCMGQQWIDFFEINSKNLINGFSQDYTHLFSRSVFIIDPMNSLALVSKLPFTHNGFAELYVPSDSNIALVLDELSRILSKRNLAYSKLTVFNVNSNECFDLLKEMEFYPFQARILGLTL